MKSLDSTVTDLLALHQWGARFFIWITARSLVDNSAQSIGFWNDVGNITTNVLDGLTGNLTSRLFYGAGEIISVDNITLTADVTIRKLNISLSDKDDAVNNFIRGYNLRNAAVQVYIGFNSGTQPHTLIDEPSPFFVGYVDEAPIVTPQEGGVGQVTLICVSAARELTRGNPDVRSNASQKNRLSNDTFYKYVVEMGEREVVWGARKERSDKYRRNKKKKQNK